MARSSPPEINAKPDQFVIQEVGDFLPPALADLTKRSLTLTTEDKLTSALAISGGEIPRICC
jgi:hypothetical protein